MERRSFIGALAASAAAAVPGLAAQPNAGQVSPPEIRRKPLTITLLGTGTPAPSLERQGSGYLFEVGEDLIVMDHGPGAHHRLLESGHRAVEVTHAFFTHLHYDHCMDYGRLVLQRWDQGADKIPDLDVYGPPPIKRMTELLIGEEGVYGPDIRARIEHQSSIDVFEARGGSAPRKRPAPRVREIHAGDVVEGKTWKITAGHASHVQPFLECLALRLDTEEGSVCYSGDSGANEQMVELARGCDMLIHMNHCFSGTAPSPAYRDAVGHHKANALTAKRAGVKTLVLTHVLGQIDQPRIREQIVHEIQQEFPGRVVWGEDLMKLTLSSPGIANIEGY
jgi:ribonuclease BN (tRNA processing enzyme)